MYNVYDVMEMMRRTQLYLDEHKYQFLKTVAKSSQKSMAEVVRDIIQNYMNRFEENDSFYDVIGIADVKEEDVASRYEDFLYNCD